MLASKPLITSYHIQGWNVLVRLCFLTYGDSTKAASPLRASESAPPRMFCRSEACSLLLVLPPSALGCASIICEREFLRSYCMLFTVIDWLPIMGGGDWTPILRELLYIANCWEVRRKFVSRFSRSANRSTDFFLGCARRSAWNY